MAARKMLQLLGHSNAEGFGGTVPLFAAYPQYMDLYASRGYTRVAGNLTPFVSESLYKNIKVWTAKSGWSAAGGTPPDFSPAEGTFLDMTVVPPYSPADPHPYSSPYNYPNNRSMPCSPVAMAATYEGGGTLHGVEIPLCWHLSHHWADTVWMMKLAVPGSLFLRFDEGVLWAGTTNTSPLDFYGIPVATTPMDTHFSWWYPGRMFDWAPGSGRFYSVWKQRMTAAAAEASAQGDVLDTRLVILWMGDNDSTVASAAFGAGASDRIRNWEVDYRAFIKQIRKDLEDNNWTQVPGSQVAIMMMGIHKDYGDTSIRTTMNGALQNIARDDPYTRFIDTTNFRVLKASGYNPPNVGGSGHYSHLGYVDAAQAVMDALIALETDTTDSLSDDDRITREDVRDRVKTYYERGRARTDATDEAINQHISSAYLHIINRVGDQAWWLRRIVDLALSADANIAQTLPRFVQRVLRIERTDNPGYPLHFELQGMTDSGRLQIVLKEGGSGTYRFHCITKAREIVGDQQAIPLPYNLIEWLVVETCRRLARASGNTTLQQSLAQEVTELSADAMRNIAAMQRARQDRLYTQRKLPTRKTLGRLYGSWIWPPQ